MLSYLRSIFGATINAERYEFPADAPFLIRDGYAALRLTWGKYECLAVRPLAKPLRLPALQKQLKIIESVTGKPCALELENVTAAQRGSLVESRTPFIANQCQAYLPFWGCAFSERYAKERAAAEEMSPSAQLVFLHLYYYFRSEPRGKSSLTQISKALRLSKSSCTRAIDSLTVSGLFKEETAGTYKWITPAAASAELLAKAMPMCKSPVGKTIYVKTLPPDMPRIYSGVQALSRISEVASNAQDGALAVSKDDAAAIPKELLITKQEFDDFGGYIIEVWKYSPSLPASNEIADEVSLLLSLNSYNDERIQKALDIIRGKHGLCSE